MIMKLRYGIVAVLLVVFAAIGTTALDDGDESQRAVSDTAAEGTTISPDEPDVDQPPDVLDADVGSVDGVEDFGALTVSEATSKADRDGRPWRIARQDDEVFGLNDDLLPGRVTFEVDDGIVTSVVIEQANQETHDDLVTEDPVRADLLAAAIRRLLTVDNGFGSADVFDDIRVGVLFGSDPSQALTALDRDAIAAGVSDIGEVSFVDDADEVIVGLFNDSPVGVAVVSVEDLVILDDRAEVGLSMWCGALCGVFLTYEAVPDVGGWDIIGTTGPIAMS